MVFFFLLALHSH
uniref:Uncharacterized protein n=1 Tax=Arundo donax TaxID=35708 RepID=A0A0A9BVM0_ARUDO